MDYIHLYNHRIRMMSPAKKTCHKCGSGYRGTRDPEEKFCAKCAVLHCQVPENIDEEFLRLVKEYHGVQFDSNPAATLPTDQIILIMEDILGQKARLQKLEEKYANRKQEKGRVNMLREIKRLKEEKQEMEKVMKKLKDKFLLFILTLPTRHKKAMEVEKPQQQQQQQQRSSETATRKSSPPSTATQNSPTSSPVKSSPTRKVLQAPVTPSPATYNNSSNTTTSVTTTDSPPQAKVKSRSPPRRSSPPREPKEEDQEVLRITEDEEQQPSTPKTSPVKQAAAKFEEAAKRVKSAVTFASNIPTQRKGRSVEPPPQLKEVNNNNTPVTASSSSDEEELESAGVLKRSNSVRDRIKRFEALQRSASTGSYDRKKVQGRFTRERTHKSMMPLNS